MKSILVAIAFFCGLNIFAQNHVSWTFTFDPETSNLVMKADIDEGWHLYSQVIDNEIGPVPTEFAFEESDAYALVGKTIEPKPEVEYDPNFDGELNFFKDEVVFAQQIKSTKGTDVKGSVYYMVCDDSMCMPPVEVEFTITIK